MNKGCELAGTTLILATRENAAWDSSRSPVFAPIGRQVCGLYLSKGQHERGHVDAGCENIADPTVLSHEGTLGHTVGTLDHGLAAVPQLDWCEMFRPDSGLAQFKLLLARRVTGTCRRCKAGTGPSVAETGSFSL